MSLIESPANTLNVAVIQHACKLDKAANLAETERLIQQISGQGIDLILLQELHSTLYFCQHQDPAYFDLAEPLDGPTRQTLAQWAQRYQCVIVGSIFEKRMHGVYHNTALVLEKTGELAGYYHKMHIPDDPGFYEKYYFTPGDAPNKGCTASLNSNGFRPIHTSVGKLGVLVCWDQWYPEAARLMALAQADLLLYPTAIGWDQQDTEQEQQRQLNAWKIIQQSHAVANHLPVLVANRVQHEPDPSQQTTGSVFWGNSFICGQQGDILAQANHTESQVLTAQLELSRTQQLRKIWPYFRDRRIDAYSALLQRVDDQ